jgi:hypothetical protein
MSDTLVIILNGAGVIGYGALARFGVNRFWRRWGLYMAIISAATLIWVVLS